MVFDAFFPPPVVGRSIFCGWIGVIFSALTLFTGRQEERVACKNTRAIYPWILFSLTGRRESTVESTNYTHNRLTAFVLSGTTLVGWYQKKHSPTHTKPDHRTSFIILLHLQRSMASSLFILRAWQSSRTTSLQVLFGLPLGLGPWTLYAIHFFTQSSSSFRGTCPYLRSLFCCKTNAMSSVPSLCLSSLLGSCLSA